MCLCLSLYKDGKPGRDSSPQQRVVTVEVQAEGLKEIPKASSGERSNSDTADGDNHTEVCYLFGHATRFLLNICANKQIKKNLLFLENDFIFLTLFILNPQKPSSEAPPREETQRKRKHSEGEEEKDEQRFGCRSKTRPAHCLCVPHLLTRVNWSVCVCVCEVLQVKYNSAFVVVQFLHSAGRDSAVLQELLKQK